MDLYDGDIDASRMRIVEGDVGNRNHILAAMKGQDVVYANLSGEVGALARNIVAALEVTGIKRLIFIQTFGIVGPRRYDRQTRMADR